MTEPSLATATAAVTAAVADDDAHNCHCNKEVDDDGRGESQLALSGNAAAATVNDTASALFCTETIDTAVVDASTTTPPLSNQPTSAVAVAARLASATALAAAPNASALLAVSRTNLDRCARMRHSHAQWQKWQHTWHDLKRQHVAASLPARLMARPLDTWRHATKKEKWNKTTLLTLWHMNRIVHFGNSGTMENDLSSVDDTIDAAKIRSGSTALPSPLQEPQFERDAPRHLLQDRDVFLARMNTRHCQVYIADQAIAYIRTSSRRQLSTVTIEPPQATTGSPSNSVTGTANGDIGGGIPLRGLPRKPKKSKGNGSNGSNTSSVDALHSKARAILTIPSPLAASLSVWTYVVRRHASLLLCASSSSSSSNQQHGAANGPNINNNLSPFAATIPRHFWMSESFFTAVCAGIQDFVQCQVPYLGFGSDNVQISMFQAVMAHFDLGLRNNPAIVQPLLESWIGTNSSVDSTKSTMAHSLFEFIRVLLKPSFASSEQKSQPKDGTTTTTTTTTPADSGPVPLLRNDKSFALYIIDLVPSIPSNAIRAFSKRLQEDIEVVTAIVQKNGLCLQHVPYKFRRHFGTCQVACNAHPQALMHCRVSKLRKDPVRVAQLFTCKRGALTTTSDTNTAVVESRATGDKRLFKELPAKIREVPDVCFAALCSGCISISDLPLSIQSSEEFWKRVLSVRPEMWLELPTALRRTAELAQSLSSIPSVRMAKDVFEHFPQLFFDRNVWLKIATSFEFAEQAFEFLSLAPAMVWHDKEIILACVRQTFDVLELLQEYPLYRDRDVIVAALECNEPEALYEVDAFMQFTHPDIVASFIRSCPMDSAWDVYDSIEDALWHNTEVVYAWLSRGGDYLHDDFLPEIADDPQAFLLIAEHNPDDFCYASTALGTNKEFLARVLEIDPTLFKELPAPALAHDFDLALIALGGSSSTTAPASTAVQRKRRDLVGLYDVNNVDDFEFLTDFAAHVHEKLALHDRFVTQILGGMSFPSITGSTSHDDRAAIRSKGGRSNQQAGPCLLSMLNQGDETSLVYKKLLAEFCGIPLGNDLRVLRRAAANLVRWGY